MVTIIYWTVHELSFFIKEIKRLLGIFLFCFVTIEAAVSFWQTSPGSFARIQLGGQQQLQRHPQLPQQQLLSVTQPYPLISEIRGRLVITEEELSNHLEPFVHFSSAGVNPPPPPPPPLPTHNHLLNAFLQAPVIPRSSTTVNGDTTRRGKRLETEADNESNDDQSQLSPKKKKTDRNAKEEKEDDLSEVSGLGSILTKLLRIKLEKDKSNVKVLLEKSIDLNKTDGRKSSFLDRLTRVMAEQEEFKEEFDDIKKDFFVKKGDRVSNEIDEAMSFFKKAGLVPDDKADEIRKHDIMDGKRTKQKAFFNILDEQEEAVEGETKDLALQLLKKAGLVPDDIRKRDMDSKRTTQNPFSFRNILDVEEEAVEKETKDLSHEISIFLSQLKGKK